MRQLALCLIFDLKSCTRFSTSSSKSTRAYLSIAAGTPVCTRVLYRGPHPSTSFASPPHDFKAISVRSSASVTACSIDRPNSYSSNGLPRWASLFGRRLQSPQTRQPARSAGPALRRNPESSVVRRAGLARPGRVPHCRVRRTRVVIERVVLGKRRNFVSRRNRAAQSWFSVQLGRPRFR